MRKFLIFGFLTALYLANPAHSEDIACPSLEADAVAQKGQMLQALVELWWMKRRLPMRQVPDHVALRRGTDKRYDVLFIKNGCSVASIAVPQDLLERYLRKRLGPEI